MLGPPGPLGPPRGDDGAEGEDAGDGAAKELVVGRLTCGEGPVSVDGDDALVNNGPSKRSCARVTARGDPYNGG